MAMLKTRITDLLGIRYPVISAPMARTSGGKLAAAVSSGGGLGTFGGINPPSIDTKYIQDQISHIRSQTDRPFGVGFLTHFIHHNPQNFDLVIEEKVPVILFSFADPRPWIGRAKENGAITICQVQTMEDAEIAVEAGADVLAAQGNEAGGHTGTMNLLPFLVRVVEEFPGVPVIASGGITNGKSLAAVLAAGAEGAWMGPAFLATLEHNEISEVWKERVIQSDGYDTVYTKVLDIAAINSPPWPDGIAPRAQINRFIQEWHGREDELRTRLDEVRSLYREARQRGDPDYTPFWFGQGARWIDGIRPAGEVLKSICEDAENHLRQRYADLIE